MQWESKRVRTKKDRAALLKISRRKRKCEGNGHKNPSPSRTEQINTNTHTQEEGNKEDDWGEEFALQ
eukprot:NODE_4445_length_661_cov_67.861111_g3796_i0.p3 GENE.NODE_4445_length_661_cov_67.861111_g3796_i0~~NODE_4445_length_661_cov_67.861111_g3796_i0.p3  ORF type:complete len:67 (-),score=9.50 NODE_4445_length_661_cov_67.861111_g3796_i0:101-301(-)